MDYTTTATKQGHFVVAQGRHREYMGRDGYWARRPEYASPFTEAAAAHAAAAELERQDKNWRR